MTSKQKIITILIAILAVFILYSISKYWWVDTLFAKGRNLNSNQDPNSARVLLEKAVSLSPNEPAYHQELSETYTNLAIESEDEGLIKRAIEQSEIATALSPTNVSLLRSGFTLFIRLSLIDPKYLVDAINTIQEALKIAPTDAKFLYNLGLTYYRIGENDRAIEILEKTVELKKNYKDARLALALLLIEKGEKQKARENLEYILKFIEPNDPLTTQALEDTK
jgi:tetratricopeptide (TPR) repeat protein